MGARTSVWPTGNAKHRRPTISVQRTYTDAVILSVLVSTHVRFHLHTTSIYHFVGYIWTYLHHLYKLTSPYMEQNPRLLRRVPP